MSLLIKEQIIERFANVARECRDLEQILATQKNLFTVIQAKENNLITMGDFLDTRIGDIKLIAVLMTRFIDDIYKLKKDFNEIL
ncbi:hypothetical protein [Testudinibacter aquarius]|uniref:Uncharacterized protein n=1 Tax=Testudinibacter aquarius TaxID=1524974 RepID=A0A4R3Y620_9PAST|nr:hypothetical protein [Testudinibacter aquarius]KAE9526047.1 hypothetical protein A1D24_03175 [Testudinibacter aquarius]TCV87240.1 hypothetical protein EDC16_105159 [Testudinibacter aquarius]TNG91282.1 hypothetical protein FHQ21_08255 [Testudinibacter aquarius]